MKKMLKMKISAREEIKQNPYSINGIGKYPKRRLATELIKLYIEQNPTLSASQVVEKWKSLGNFVSHFVETQETMTSEQIRT